MKGATLHMSEELFLDLEKLKRRCMSIWALVGSLFIQNKGFSLLESLLGIVILTTMFLVLLPVTFQLYDGVKDRQISLSAMNTNYNGLAMYKQDNRNTSGVVAIEGLNYHWTIDEQQVCTNYVDKIGEQKKCVQFKK